MDLAAGKYTPRPLYRGLQGWDVYALQKGLLAAGYLAEPQEGFNGSFGPLTKSAVINFQARHGLVADGIAGPKTKIGLSGSLTSAEEARRRVPRFLLKGIVGGESAHDAGQYTAPYRDGSRDLGITQENEQPTLANLLKVFDPAGQIDRLAFNLVGAKNYANVNGKGVYVDTEKEQWELAVLYHNWPAAYYKYVDGTIATWTYRAFDSKSGTYKYYRMDQPAQWIINIGVAGVQTGYQWKQHYIQSKTLYVTDWSV